VGARKKSRLTAKTADKHLLYQLSVQDATVECDFIDRVFRRKRGRKPRTLLEHFCGTALVCGEWARRGPQRRATGVDIDPKVLAWGRKNNLAKLGDAGERVTLLRQDVRDPVPQRFDAVSAMNFSYWIFRTRTEMRAYFAHVKKLLNKDGIFVLDAYGGWESQEIMQERRRIKGGFTYVWDQNQYDPITHEVVNYIHFEFQNGSKMMRAFEYHWRFWTLPELRELLAEAGFSDVNVYWDCSQKDTDEEDYRPRSRAQNQPGWLAYLVAGR
jgi:SAM-dependent methyltransferase